MLPTWMTPPPPSNDQAAAGARVYYYRCMACHGDRGQGLTVEWRAQWPPGHQDCSVPLCHGNRHPPEGFKLPRNLAPALIGDDALARFATAREVYDFISTRMPYQAPGSLSADEYWQLVAFLLKRNRVNVDQVSPQNASAIYLHQPRAQINANGFLWVGVPSIILLGGIFLWRRSARSRETL